MLPRCQTIIGEVSRLLERCRPDEVEQLYAELSQAPRVMAYATGRSGFLLRAFIMRLNHLGQEAFYVGEASTPPVREGDVFLVLSGSGSTATALGAAMEASKLGARVMALVGTRVSPLGQLAEVVVELPAPHKRGTPGEGAETSIQTVGSLFEQAAYILLESLVLRRFEIQGADLRAPLERHANLEA